MPADFYEARWIIFIYAVAGWCCEVCFAAVCGGKFVSRGFLAGPVCPIYGFGVLGVVAALDPLKENLILLFIGSVVITSAIEFAVGWILERFFRQKWWDYSDKPFNVKGYICLSFSLLWGFACVFVVRLIHPSVLGLVRRLPRLIGWIILAVFCVLILTDLSTTAAGLLSISKKLRAAEEIEASLRKFSDALGSGLSKNTLIAAEKNEKFKERVTEKLNEKRSETEALYEKYKSTLASKSRTHNRLIKAFPQLGSGKRKLTPEKLREFLDEVREKIEERKK